MSAAPIANAFALQFVVDREWLLLIEPNTIITRFCNNMSARAEGMGNPIKRALSQIKGAASDIARPFFEFTAAVVAIATVASFVLPSKDFFYLGVVAGTLIVVYPAIRILLNLGQVLGDLEKVEFRAIPYSESTDLHLAELSAFAAQAFKGDTIPADLVRNAIRNGSMLGLRLADKTGKNIGFLDLIHFRDEVMDKWMSGEDGEAGMDISDFEPIHACNPSKQLRLAVGALLVKQPVFSADVHLTEAFVYAGIAYFRNALANFVDVRVYATIFNPKGGQRWAQFLGFTRDTLKENRLGLGKKHDVYKLDLRDEPLSLKVQTDKKKFVGIGDDREFVVVLDSFGDTIKPDTFAQRIGVPFFHR